MKYNEEEELQKAQTQIVAKDNRVIQNAARRDVEKNVYKLSLLEQKALAYICSLIKKPVEGEDPQYTYKIDRKVFCDICGIQNNSGANMENLKRTLRKLASNGVWVKLEDGSTMYLQWITTPVIKDDCIEVFVPPRTLPFLCGLQKNFTAYNLDQVLCLSGKYSIALFELLKSNLYKGTFDISIEEFREYMGLGDEYREFKQLRRRVVVGPIEEINRKPTGLIADWEPVRAYHGHSYAAIRFTVREKKPMEQAKAKLLEDGKGKKSRTKVQDKSPG